MSLPPGATRVTLPAGGAELLAEEVPVALVFDGVTQAVMMATPADLDDFLLGFALTEGLIAAPDEILRQEIMPQPRGIEARAWLAAPAGARFAARRRAMAGPVGCGLCGIDSLEQALRPLPRHVGAAPLSGAPEVLARAALNALQSVQSLHDHVRASHAAALWSPVAGILALREDVGRHNALDKLAGALARAGIDAAQGAIVMTSRLSVDLVQKAAMIGAGTLIAPSAPTALAVTEAQAAGLALIARGGAGYLRYTAPETQESAA